MNTDSIPPVGGTYAADLPEKDIRLWSMLCHLMALCGIPFPTLGAVIGPLIVWLLKRNEHPTIDANGKEALNFHLSVLLYTWGLAILGVLTVWILIGFVFLGLAAAIAMVALFLSAWAAYRTSNGETYRYPLTIRFLK